MKHLLPALLLAFFSTTSAFADTPAKIAEDYQKQSTAALAKLNTTLEKATTPLIATLIKAGDTSGAEQLTAQLKSKLAGEPVPTPQSSAALLFAQYDQARANAIKPAQKAAISRIDAMLSGKEGKELGTVTELGKVREEIELGLVNQAPSQAVPKSFLRKNKIPVKWGFFLSPQYPIRYGTLFLNDDGTLMIEAAGPISGTWKPTSDPTVLAVELKESNAPAEKAEMTIKGKDAVINTPSRMRYFKAD